MTQIKDAARIIRNGRVTTPKALVAAVVATCAASTCTNTVIKDGNFCSMTCALTPAPAPVQEPAKEEPMTDLELFFQDCERADWYFQFSGVSAMWRRGKEGIERLEARAKADPTLQPVYDAWKAYVASTINGAGSTLPTLEQFTNPTPDVEETPVSDHVAPCKDMLNGCIDAECQARVHIREHVRWNMSEQDRIKHSNAIIAALHSLLNDPMYATADPEALAAQAIENGVQNVREGFTPKVHVQAPKAVLSTTTKAVRTPRVAKHQPRITDNQEHPVTKKITLTESEMEAAITKAVEARIAAREAEIKATPRVAPADKPVEVVTKKGGRAKIERATAQMREHKGLTLPAFIVDKSLTVPALEIGEQSLDTLASSKERSPYNKARFRLDGEPVALDPEVTTYRVLMAEHARLMGLAAAKPAKKAKAKKEAAPKIAVVVDAGRLAKVAALVTTLGMTRAEAEALVG